MTSPDRGYAAAIQTLDRARAPVAAPPRPSWWGTAAVGALVGVLVVAIGARFATSSSLWLDEALTVNIASLPLEDLGPALRRDGSPPLFYVLLHVWMAVVGSGDVAVRALSGICSVAALVVVAVLGAKLAGRKGAVAAAVLFAVNPLAIRYATEARMYAFVMLLTALGALAVISALERPTAWRLVGVGAATTALLSSHYWAIYLVAATGLLLAGLIRWGAASQRAAAGRCLLALAAGVVAWLPWVPSFLHQVAHTSTPWGDGADGWTLPLVLFVLAGGETEAAGALTVLAGIVGLVAVATRRADDGHLELVPERGTPAQAFLVVTAAVVVLGIVSSALVGAAFVARYASVALVPFVVVLALGLARLSRPVRTVGLASFVVLGLLVMPGLHGFQRTQAPELAAAIEAGAEPGDVIAYCPDQLGPAIDRLLDGTWRQVALPRLDGPELVDWTDYREAWESTSPRQLARELHALAGPATLWLVVDTDYTGTETACRAVRDVLADLRDGEEVVRADGRYFENASLWELPGSGRRIRTA